MKAVLALGPYDLDVMVTEVSVTHREPLAILYRWNDSTGLWIRDGAMLCSEPFSWVIASSLLLSSSRDRAVDHRSPSYHVTWTPRLELDVARYTKPWSWAFTRHSTVKWEWSVQVWAWAGPEDVSKLYEQETQTLTVTLMLHCFTSLLLYLSPPGELPMASWLR